MKLAICFAAMTALLGNCYNSYPHSYKAVTDQFLDYSIGEDQYAVVIVQDEGISDAQAKTYARKRAAQVAFENGFRYITIESEQIIQVLKSSLGSEKEQTPAGNLYEELVLEEGGTREQLAQQAIPVEQMLPAYRIVFHGYTNKPTWKAIDICTLTNCK